MKWKKTNKQITYQQLKIWPHCTVQLSGLLIPLSSHTLCHTSKSCNSVVNKILTHRISPHKYKNFQCNINLLYLHNNWQKLRVILHVMTNFQVRLINCLYQSGWQVLIHFLALTNYKKQFLRVLSLVSDQRSEMWMIWSLLAYSIILSTYLLWT